MALSNAATPIPNAHATVCGTGSAGAIHPGSNAAAAATIVTPASQSSPKWEKTCPDSWPSIKTRTRQEMR